jgi:glycosyltransferase involved in cell wall biosynthesis
LNQPRRPVLVVIPAYNEAATVAEVVRGVIEHTGCAVLVVNDASADDTAVRARAAGASVIDLPINLGAWGAAQTGMRYAQRHRYGTVITLDADGQHHPESVPALLAALDGDEADVVIGTYAQRLSTAKRIAWWYFRMLTGLPVRDFTSGLRAYNRRAVRTLAAREASLLDYQDMGVLMLLNQKGFRLHELETPMSPRQSGMSRVFASWFVVARYMLHTTVLCCARLDVRGRIAQRAAIRAEASA